MKVYTKVKFISKTIITISIMCSILALGIFALKQNTYLADEAQTKKPSSSVTIEKNGGEIAGATICHESFKNKSLERFRLPKDKKEGEEINDEPELIYDEDEDNDGCYFLQNSNNYRSVAIDSATFRVIDQALRIVKDADKTDLRKITGRYAAQLRDKDPDFAIDTNQATLLNKDVIKQIQDEIGSKNITNTKNAKYDPEIDSPQITIDLSKDPTFYEDPADPSLWIITKDAIVNLITDKWTPFGEDFSHTLSLLNEAEEAYFSQMNYKKESKVYTQEGVTIYLDFPKEIDIDYPKNFEGIETDINPKFKIKIDIEGDDSRFEDINKPYVKIFIKPSEQKDEEKVAQVCASTNGANITPSNCIFRATDIEFAWPEIKKQLSELVSTNTLATDSIYMDYSPDIPRRYFYHIQVAGKNGDFDANTPLASTKGEFTATTLERDAISTSDGESTSQGALFDFKVPSTVSRDSSANISFTVNHDIYQGKTVDKIVLWACNDFPFNSVTNDNDCKIAETGQEAKKGAWLSSSNSFQAFIESRPSDDKTKKEYESNTWKKFQYLKKNIYTWTTNGLQPGIKKNIMIKAFTYDPSSSNLDDPFTYIDKSRTISQITVSSSSDVGPITSYARSRSSSTIGKGFSLGASLASDWPEGSPIRDISTLVNRYTSIVSGIIGAIAFLVIIIAGFIYITAGSDDNKLNKAKKAIIYAIIGLVVATFSYVVLKMFISDYINKLGLPSIESIMKQPLREEVEEDDT